jgi:murein DD-endopeptidase MepM/ murein hydrolase activator NlpD
MLARALLVFFMGFATGVVSLAALLWQTHTLRTTSAASAPIAAPPLPSPATIQPQSAPPPIAIKPIAPAPAPDAPASSDDVTLPSQLLVPVQGATAGDLHDNFQDTRDGHRHEALDIMAPRGTPVLAVAEGNVIKLFLSKPGGLTVYQFDDSQTWCYYYAHLDHYATGLKEGTLLRKGDVLGYVGTTGNAPPNAPHLHFAIFKLGPEKRWWEGTAVNPYPILIGQANQ